MHYYKICNSVRLSLVTPNSGTEVKELSTRHILFVYNLFYNISKSIKYMYNLTLTKTIFCNLINAHWFKTVGFNIITTQVVF